MGDRNVKSDENKKKLYIDAKMLYFWAINDSLPYDEFKLDENVELEEILKTQEDLDTGYLFEVDLRYLDNTKEKQNNFHSYPKKKSLHYNYID